MNRLPWSSPAPRDCSSLLTSAGPIMTARPARKVIRKITTSSSIRVKPGRPGRLVGVLMACPPRRSLFHVETVDVVGGVVAHGRHVLVEARLAVGAERHDRGHGEPRARLVGGLDRVA